jgi:hypothetical protein
MEQLIIDNISAIFALLGTLLGALLTLVGTWFLQSRANKAHLLEKILDRRIQAHENIIEMSKLLRMMDSLGYSEIDGELVRYPNIMASKESLDDFLYKFAQTAKVSSTWLSTEVIREVYFAQDYFIYLYEMLRPKESATFPEIGRIIRQDFINISDTLEKYSFDYFKNDLTKLKVNDLSKWHKYPLEITKKRLGETILFQKMDELNKQFLKE